MALHPLFQSICEDHGAPKRQDSFTAGPWQRRDDYDGALTIIGNVDGESFSDGTTSYSYDFIANCEDDYGEPTSPANVRLILAAPELYKALLELASAVATTAMPSQAIDLLAPHVANAKAAIDKVRA
jgi:hypothetical protein